nr:translation initiation factor IF-2-like [Aegilops tauschii subsp. strangulata]
MPLRPRAGSPLRASLRPRANGSGLSSIRLAGSGPPRACKIAAPRWPARARACSARPPRRLPTPGRAPFSSTVAPACRLAAPAGGRLLVPVRLPSTCRLDAYTRGAGSSSLRAAPDPAAPVRPRLRPAASLRPWPVSTAPHRLRPPARPRASVRPARAVACPSRPALPQPPCGLAPTTPRRLRPCPGLPRRLPGRGASAGRPAPPWPALAALADSLLQPTSPRAAGLPLQPASACPSTSRRLAPSQGWLPKKRKRK